MKLRILTFTGLLTLCMAAPVEAGVIIDFGLSDHDRPGIIIAPERHSDWDYAPGYREGRGYRQRYYPRYRRSQFYDSHYFGKRSRFKRKYDRYHHPRRSNIQLRIGF